MEVSISQYVNSKFNLKPLDLIAQYYRLPGSPKPFPSLFLFPLRIKNKITAIITTINATKGTTITYCFILIPLENHAIKHLKLFGLLIISYI